jgi:(E)-4-hydroxy-3-methylbut-2-enyl-diphosphate synthase
LVRLTALPQRRPAAAARPAENQPPTLGYDPFSYQRRPSQQVDVGGLWVGERQTVRVAAPESAWKSLANALAAMGDFQPEICYETSSIREVDPCNADEIAELNQDPAAHCVAVRDGSSLGVVAAYRWLASVLDPRHPILLKDTLSPEQAAMDSDAARLHAAAVLGSLLCDGIGDAVLVRCEPAPAAALRLSYNILQAAGARIFKTDYVACPSCGRTLFNLQQTTRKIRDATGHLKGVRIAVMGCIVNGPGEMADADFGYVGGAPGKINLYVGKTPVQFNIPEDEAVGRLIDLIREHGRWVEPPAQPVATNEHTAIPS